MDQSKEVIFFIYIFDLYELMDQSKHERNLQKLFKILLALSISRLDLSNDLTRSFSFKNKLARTS